jgi:HD-GYP domain-containing protein (c-di-GMP phosphodiesterase class II)
MMTEKENGFVLSKSPDHAFIGYRILNSFEKTMDIARIVLSHHEKWNGSGYPNGLNGEDIPLLSRIITVADRYDRHTSRYSASPVTEEDAFFAMEMESGTILDGSLVDLLIEIKKKKVSGA